VLPALLARFGAGADWPGRVEWCLAALAGRAGRRSGGGPWQGYGPYMGFISPLDYRRENLVGATGFEPV